MEYKGFILDKFQEDAIRSIESNNSVVVSAPTGSGKTLIADYIVNKDIRKGIRVVYTAPIKALSNQKYKEFTAEYGIGSVGLLTGDIVKNPEAPVLIMTTEIYRNMTLTNDPMLESISYVIFDEIHFINDIERGYVWEESIIFSKPNVRFLCLSATIPNADEFATWIQHIKKHKVDVIRHDQRNVPLHRAFFDAYLGVASLEQIRDNPLDVSFHKMMGGKSAKSHGRYKPPSHIELVSEIFPEKLPCFFFCFSRSKCQDLAVELSKKNIFEIDTRIGAEVRKKLADAPPEINSLKSTKMLRQTLPYGIAFHHAGLIPVIKDLVESLFSLGLIKVLYTTETFAVGINMPARSVCFESLRKFDGVNFRLLNSKEYFQIAGRAGRRGIDKEGFVYAMLDRRDFNYKLMKKMTSKDTEPIKSQFRLSVNTVLNLIKQHNQAEIEKILSMNFGTFQKYGRMIKSLTNTLTYRNFLNIRKRLDKFGYLSGNSLTGKGEFASKIYSDEILAGEMFATEFYSGLDEFHILMLIACLCYEPREKTKFFARFPSQRVKHLQRKLLGHHYMRREKRFRYLDDLTALVHPCYYGKSIFDIIQNTSLLEGDIIRFFRQMLDRIGQIKGATQDNRLREMLFNCQGLILKCVEDIDAV